MDRYIYKWVSPRQPLTSLPYVIFAGILAATQLPAGMVSNNEAGVSLSEAFNGSSSGLTGLNTANRTGKISASVLLILNACNIVSGTLSLAQPPGAAAHRQCPIVAGSVLVPSITA